MPINNFEKAKILNQALPYIREFEGKIMVVKLGGSILEKNNDSTFINDLVLMKYLGIKVIIIHGGGKQVSQLLKRLGKESKFIGGLRVTDQESMEIVQMVLSGQINKNLVSYIQNAGGNAVGLSGKDADMAIARPIKGKTEDLGLVGEIKSIKLDLIKKLIDDSYIPVISSIASDGKKGSFNINADHFATEIAIGLKSEKLIFLSDVAGVLENKNDESSLINKIKINNINHLIKSKTVKGGMIPKLESAYKSIEAGIHCVHFLSGKTPHSLLVELLTDEEIGTQIFH